MTETTTIAATMTRRSRAEGAGLRLRLCCGDSPYNAVSTARKRTRFSIILE
jgi:hypothetical protein